MNSTMDRSVAYQEEREEIQRISFKSKLAYGVGHVLNDICASMWFSYLFVYFHLILGFSPVYSGVILLIGQIADALATPFVGLHSDKDDDYWLCCYGKRKTWHLIGTICVLGAFPFIFSQCIGCQTSHQWAQLIYYAAFVIIFQFGWASVQISHLSLIPDLTPSDEERTLLTAIRYSFTVFSNILVHSVTFGVLHVTQGSSNDQIGPKDAGKFQIVVFIGLFIGLMFTIIFHIFVKESKTRDNSSQTRVTAEGQSRQLIPPFSLFKDPRLYLIACIYMPTRLFVNLPQTYMPLYLHETLHMPATALAMIPLIMYLSGFKASITINYLNSKIGREASYTIGALMGIGACTWIWFGKGDDYIKLFIYPVSLLLGSASSMVLVTSLSITADYIGHSTENGAFIYGIMSFSDKLSNGIVVMIIQYLKCSVDCQDYYKIILTFVCGGAVLVGLFMTLLRKIININYDDDVIDTNYSSVITDTEENRRSGRT